ncbi:hypothetical protein HGB13_00490 [bacterium]|nr:hypothetical protein [bacterium]
MKPELFWVENSDGDMFLVDNDWRIYAIISASEDLVQRPGEPKSRPTREYTLTYINEDGTIFEGKYYSTSQRDKAIKIAHKNAHTPTSQYFYHRIA